MSAYYSTAFSDYCLQQFEPLVISPPTPHLPFSPLTLYPCQANQSEYPSIIHAADYLTPQISTPATFTLSDIYCHQATLSDSYQFPAVYSPSDCTESPPNTGYLTTQSLLRRQPHQNAGRNIWGVRPDPDPLSFIPEADLIPSIRKASLPPSLFAARASAIAPSPPETHAPLRGHSDVAFHSPGLYISSLGAQGQDEGYGSSSSTTTPSPTPSPTSATFPSSSLQASVKSEASSDSGYRSSSSQLKHTDFRRKRADRRRSKLLEIASVLPFRATDP